MRAYLSEADLYLEILLDRLQCRHGIGAGSGGSVLRDAVMLHYPGHQSFDDDSGPPLVEGEQRERGERDSGLPLAPPAAAAAAAVDLRIHIYVENASTHTGNNVEYSTEVLQRLGLGTQQPQ